MHTLRENVASFLIIAMFLLASMFSALLQIDEVAQS